MPPSPSAARRSARRFEGALRWRDALHPRQTAVTPPFLADLVRALLGGRIGLDPATTPDNPMGAERFVCPPGDGLAEPWSGDVWCNPPYGARNLERWIDKALASALDRSCRIALLVPAYVETRGFHAALAGASTTLLIRSRLEFGDGEGGARAATHGSALFGFNLDLAPLADLGTVVDRIAGEIDASRPPEVALDLRDRSAPKGYAEVGGTRLGFHSTDFERRLFSLWVPGRSRDPTIREARAVALAVLRAYPGWQIDFGDAGTDG